MESKYLNFLLDENEINRIAKGHASFFWGKSII